ncbi:NAD(P)/FAD-dependent oxidoreductase [Tumidithrix elongata RA019]|uniref:NAD(P)/FAD-dependent oxidoreductase n=1 Tax=Tumidithrix elongata BACA0141 TaxID=2716417 RepID=A0AAW9PYS2_9CYAN|nr:NAD(P)/FAD-dependent oxidoreductase [Tumidithrix elongata RA019]
MSRICILGGGFGGLYTALNLVRLPWAETPEIILIDKSDRFMFTPMLYELITGELQAWEIAPPFADLLEGKGIQFIQATVTDIDLNDRHVRIDASGQSADLHYDRLLLAIGGETPIDFVPGASEYAIPFRTLADANRLIHRLEELEKSDRGKIRVCIAGAGSSGVELACKIADRLKERGRVRLVDRNDRILSGSPEPNRVAAEQALSKRGVWKDLSTSVSEVGETEITLDYQAGSDTLPVDIVMWTVGTRFSKLIQKLPLDRRLPMGQITVEPTLQVKTHPELFAIGDLASCLDTDGTPLPGTAQVAYQQAHYCALNIWASITNHPLLPFQYIPLGEFISLGVNDASMSMFGKIAMDGMPAYVARRLAYLLRMPTLEHQLKVSSNWLVRPILSAWERVQK